MNAHHPLRRVWSRSPLVSASLLTGILLAIEPCAVRAETPPAQVDPCAVVPALLPVAAEIRGLAVKAPVRCEALSPEEFERRGSEAARAVSDPAKLAHEERVYSMLGLIAEDFPYARCMRSDSSLPGLAVFDPARNAIRLRSDIRTPPSAIVHELTHALQHQHFDLTAFRLGARTSDGILARSALAEGDATWVEEEYLRRAPETEVRGDDRKSVATDPACTPPEALVEVFDFPYTIGHTYVRTLRVADKSGESLNERYRTPPGHTKEIIFARPAVAPAAAAFPPDWAAIDAGSGFPPFRPVLEDELGAWIFRQLLQRFIKRNDSLLASQLLASDRLVFSESSHAEAVEWELRAANSEGAARLEVPIRHYLERRFGLPPLTGPEERDPAHPSNRVDELAPTSPPRSGPEVRDMRANDGARLWLRRVGDTIRLQIVKAKIAP